ncbi:MAG: rhodanese-like domain-containing protein [Gammaproteobacteria bacterium]
MKELLVLASLTSLFGSLFGVDWEAVDRLIASRFPAVESLTVAELYRRHQQGGNLPPIIDVRADEEFQVSHLVNAFHLESAEQIAARFPDLEAELILYCSVGYRSAAVADALRELGYTRIVNLRHSLFEWANQGLPLVNAQGPTPMAHPFNRRWGKLLRPELHATRPAS